MRRLSVSVVMGLLSVWALPGVAGAGSVEKCCNQILANGQAMDTGTGERLVMQTDGNLVLYVNGAARWATNSVGKPSPYVKAQSDGNVVAYTSSGSAFWDTYTFSIYPNARLALQDDGNLVVYYGTTAVWAVSWSQDPNGAREYAKKMFPHWGWSVTTQFPCLDKLWIAESGWRWNADNPNSSAYGIPQALPGSRMAASGTNWVTDGLTQVEWGLNYIRNHQNFNSPCTAWAWKQKYGTY